MCVLWSNKCMQGLKNIHYELTNYRKYLKEKYDVNDPNLRFGLGVIRGLAKRYSCIHKSS